MYRERDLQTCLWGLVGFRQNQNPDYPELAPSLLESSSGLYFQDEHPLLTIENISQAVTNYDAYNYPLYNPATSYAIGDKVRDGIGGKVYESLTDDNAGNAPGASPDHWAEVNLFSQKLEALVRASITKVAARVMQMKKLRETTKTLLENVQLFDGNGSLNDKEIKLGRFVGFRLMVEDHRDLAVVIRRLGTQFTEPNPDFKLYVFHTSQVDPIAVVPVALAKASSFEWSKIDLALRYLSEEYGPGGSFRIGYYEDQLQGQAINRGYDFGVSPAPCNCNKWYSYYLKWSKFIRVQPFAVTPDVVPGPDGSGAQLWNIESEVVHYRKSYGLNFDITIKCDTTDFLCREKDLFVEPIIKQVANDLLGEMAYSVRNNVLAKEVRQAAMYALETRPNSNPGAAKMLEKAIAALDFDLSDLNEACLPCNDSKGPYYGTL